MSLNLLVIFLEIVTLEPISAQTGIFNLNFTLFFFTSTAIPTVAAEFTLSIRDSPIFIGSTLSSVFVPTTLFNRYMLSTSSYQTGGAFPKCVTTEPASWSDFTIEGSRNVRKPIEPPGYTSSTSEPPEFRLEIAVVIGFHT